MLVCAAQAWTNQKRQQHIIPSTRLFATSSSDLKKKGKKETFDKSCVVHRLSRAAKNSHKRAQQQAKQPTKPAPTKPPVRLSDLTGAIDRELAHKKSLYNNDILRPARESMVAVVGHNHQNTPTTTGHKEIAFVLAKPLLRDQITLEYACRIQKLVQMIVHDHYRPQAIFWVGGVAPGNHVADADAGYLYFRHLCAAQGMDPDEPRIFLEHNEDAAFHNAVVTLQLECLADWKQELEDQTEFELDGLVRRKKRLQVHFSLISSDYHLCQLNDLHSRSPGQSPLRALGGWMRASVDTTWSYHAAVPTPPVSDPVVKLSRKFFQTAQDLLPVVQNLRGVVKNREFFQRDNYRVLIAARRTLVTLIEGLYEKEPSLKAVHRNRGKGGKPMDVVLEAALLNLGRCLDLVRPAGQMSGSVSESEWKMAVQTLESAYKQINQACDPDQPLDPLDWGYMFDELQDMQHDETDTQTQTQ